MSTEELDHDSTDLDHDFVHGQKGKKRSKKHLHHLFHISGTRRKKIASSVGSARGGTEHSFPCLVKSTEQSKGERGYEGRVFLLWFILVVGKERLRLNKGKNSFLDQSVTVPFAAVTGFGRLAWARVKRTVRTSAWAGAAVLGRASELMPASQSNWLDDSPRSLRINTEFRAYLSRVFSCEGLLRFEVVSSISRLGSLCHWGCQNTHLPVQWYHLKPTSGPFHCYGLNCVPQNLYSKALTPNMTAFGGRAKRR